MILINHKTGKDILRWLRNMIRRIEKDADRIISFTTFIASVGGNRHREIIKMRRLHVIETLSECSNEVAKSYEVVVKE